LAGKLKEDVYKIIRRLLLTQIRLDLPIGNVLSRYKIAVWSLLKVVEGIFAIFIVVNSQTFEKVKRGTDLL